MALWSHGLPLPPVLSFVLHQGPEAWNVSTAFEDLFELPDDIAADLLPFLPKFHHALLDLSRSDPASEESDTQLRMVRHLMKLARERQLLRYFRRLAESLVEQVPDSLLGRLLLYALHADSELDARQIYRSLTTNPELEKRAMSVAEKLKAEGRMEGNLPGNLPRPRGRALDWENPNSGRISWTKTDRSGNPGNHASKADAASVKAAICESGSSSRRC